MYAKHGKFSTFLYRLAGFSFKRVLSLGLPSLAVVVEVEVSLLVFLLLPSPSLFSPLLIAQFTRSCRQKEGENHRRERKGTGRERKKKRKIKITSSGFLAEILALKKISYVKCAVIFFAESPTLGRVKSGALFIIDIITVETRSKSY